MRVDLYATVRKYGYPIQVLKDCSQTLSRCPFPIVE
jgi:hypothetical protein